MPGVFVVTDSSCDLEQDDIAPFNIEIVPLTIRFGNEEFTDRLDLSTEDFYRRIQKRGTCFRPGLSLVSVHISQTLEGDRGIPVHTGHRPQLTSCLGEASRCVPASEPIVEIAACCHDM